MPSITRFAADINVDLKNNKMVAKRKVFLRRNIVKYFGKTFCENADMSSVNIMITISPYA